jgi:hypothetical protein
MAEKESEDSMTLQELAEAIEKGHHPRPEYCPDHGEDEVCTACGADPRPGIPYNWCKARTNGPPPTDYGIRMVLVDKRTGELV